MPSFAARTFDWTTTPGKAMLNGESIELRGFSHHNSFAGLGSVQPPRLRSETKRKASASITNLSGQTTASNALLREHSLSVLVLSLWFLCSLFKGQLSRALGANSWRMSHNPYDTALYEMLTELGVIVWDEARDYSPEYIQDWREQVKLHRRHPSICIWSYCNEEECCQVR